MTQYYVKPTGSDGNDGLSIANAWQTISKPLATITAGDICDVLAGTYSEGNLKFTNDGTSFAAGDVIRLRAHQTDVPNIVGNGTNNNIINMSASKFIIIEGIDFEYQQDVTGNSQCIIGFSGAEDIRIKDCRFYDDTHGATPLAVFDAGYRTRAIQVDGARWEIDNCEFWNVQHPIHLRLTHTLAWVHDCTIHDCYQSFVVHGNNVELGTVIQDNTLEDSYIEDGIQTTHIDANSFNVQGLIIKGNIIRNNNENAIDLKGTKNVWIENNIIYGTVGSNDGPVGGWNRDAWTTISRGTGTSAKENVIRNNIFYDNAPVIKAFDGYKVYNNVFISNNRDFNGSDQNNDGHSSGGPFSYRRLGGDDLAFLNNIVVNHNQVEFLANGDVKYDIDHNLYITGANWGDQVPDPDDIYTTLASWRTFLSGETNPVSTEQNSIQVADLAAIKFVTAPTDPDNVTGVHTAFDFHILTDSPAKEAGRWLTKASGAGSASTSLTVDDARFFRDAFGNGAGIVGDKIEINSTTVTITNVNYGTNTLTITPAATWSDNDPVYFDYLGSSPDIGVFEFAVSTVTASATLAASGALSASAIGGVPTAFDLLDLNLTLAEKDERFLTLI